MGLIDLLSQYDLYSEELQAFLNQHTYKIQVPKNEIFSPHDTYNTQIYFVEKGLSRSFYYEKGKDITTKFYQEGRLMAHIDTLFENQNSKYNLETIEDSEIVYCDYRKLEEFCKESIAVANFSRFILGKLLVQMSERIASLQYRTATERYDQLMKENPDILLRAPLRMVASYLGISQETLSRIRAKGTRD